MPVLVTRLPAPGTPEPGAPMPEPGAPMPEPGAPIPEPGAGAPTLRIHRFKNHRLPYPPFSSFFLDPPFTSWGGPEVKKHLPGRFLDRQIFNQKCYKSAPRHQDEPDKLNQSVNGITKQTT